MAKCDKLLAAARNNPAGLRFAEVCQLAECYGFVLARSSGSHNVYTHDGLQRPLNFQEAKNGKAKGYQVKQLLGAIDALPEEDGEDE